MGKILKVFYLLKYEELDLGCVFVVFFLNDIFSFLFLLVDVRLNKI